MSCLAATSGIWEFITEIGGAGCQQVSARWSASPSNRLPRNETLKRGVRSLGTEDRLKRYQNVFSLAPAETIDGLFRDDILPQRQWP